jgi:ligand-binding sensor domain-containing protein
MRLFRHVTTTLITGIFFLFPCLLYAKVGDWKNYTNMKDVRSVIATGSSLWAGTSGGVFRFSPSDSLFQKFTNSEGLSGNDVTAIGSDPSGAIWIGESSGQVDVYSPATGTWSYIPYIEQSVNQQKNINSFYSYGDSMYIATAFGISIYVRSKSEFSDTYSNFGSFSQPGVLSVVVNNGIVYAATTAGMVVSKAGALNLEAPQSWETFSAPAQPTAVTVFRGTVYAASVSGLYEFQSDSWQPISGLVTSCSSLAASDSLLYISLTNSVATVTPSNVVSVLSTPTPDSITTITLFSSSIVVGLYNGGIAQWNAANSQWKIVFPNGPESNFFNSLAVDDNEVLWCATGTSAGSGFCSFDGKTWKNYTTTTYPQLPTNNYYSVSIGPNNSKWFSSWGAGIAVVNSAGNLVRIFGSEQIPSLNFTGFPTPVGSNPPFPVAGQIAADRFGNVWVPIYDADNKLVLWEMKSDSQWVSYHAALSNQYSKILGVAIDRNDTKWCMSNLFNFPASPPAFMYFNESTLIGQEASDGWGELTEADGMTSEAVTALALDKDGSLWAGTISGITIINDPSYPTTGISQVYIQAINETVINCIAVDPLNNKWVGTAQGVFVLSPDGTSVISQYDVANTNGKLVDDNVVSIAFDTNRGIVYFGTFNGLSSLEIPVTQPVETMSTLQIYPNPLILPDNNEVTINGLVDNATIKVLSTSGILVKQFSAQGGGRAFWDGTNAAGKPVGSGIYIIVASTESGDQVSTAKVAVIRR